MAIVGGFGAPELVLILIYAVIPLVLAVIAFVILYFVVKRAVRNGVREAMEDAGVSGKHTAAGRLGDRDHSSWA